MSKKNPLIAAFTVFEEKRYSLGNFGAANTEPRCVAYDTIERYLNVGVRTIPSGADGWQLYSETPGAGRAAKSLSAALRKLMNAIDKATQSQVVEFREYVGI